ncbi:MAG: hypothetical protein C3F07_15690 [Anaerolineales bacterium]|nr:hypothetical protein [Anaerolineae bacterium]PWB70902.1 MAG: hypothetical protein C3F07_15690 [Anaerolineales bacterium]
MKTKSLLTTILLFTLALSACAPKPSTPTKAAPTTAVQKTEPTGTKVPPTVESKPTEKPTEAATQAVTATPENLSVNVLSINDQTGANGDILINLVTAKKPGWVAVFTDNKGQPGTLLGYVPVPAGTSEDVKVPVDRAKVTSKMIAVLFVDAGTIGTFEYPGADEIAVESGNNVMMVFNKITG